MKYQRCEIRHSFFHFRFKRETPRYNHARLPNFGLPCTRCGTCIKWSSGLDPIMRRRLQGTRVTVFTED